MQDFFQACGVSFKIWVMPKTNNKLDWTSLSGNEKKKLLKTLPEKLRAHPYPFIHENTRLMVADLWSDFASIYFDILTTSTEVTEELSNSLFTKFCKWIDDFVQVGIRGREGYGKGDITPYMHIVAYHLPYLLSFHSGIKPFTGQGLEKVNDDLKNLYFKRCNKMFAASQTLRARFRKSLTRKYRPVKRVYTKKSKTYWANLKRKKSVL